MLARWASRRAQVILGSAAFLLIARLSAEPAPASAETTRSPIGSVKAIRQGFPGNQGQPVHLTGHITFYSSGWPVLFFQDSTGGTIVEPFVDAPLTHGRRVELEGQVGAGGAVYQPRVRFLSDSESWPTAPAVEAKDFNSGGYDARMVTIRGRLFSIRREGGHFLLGLLGEQGEALRASVPQSNVEQATLEGWIDAALQLTGVSGVSVDAQGRVWGIRLWVPGQEQITPMPTDQTLPNFSRLRQSVLDVRRRRRSTPDAVPVVVAGVVTWQDSDTSVYLQDDKGGIRAASREALALRPGTGVEVVGLLAGDPDMPFVDQALVRVNRSLPSTWGNAKTLQFIELLNGGYWGALVSLNARVVGLSTHSNLTTLSLESEERFFSARWTGDNDAPIRAELRPGADITLTGVCVPRRDASQRPVTAEVQLRSTQDLAVVGRTLRFALRTVIATIAFVTALAVLGLLWVTTLRAQVRRRTQALSESEERLRAFFEAATDYLFIKDSSLRYLRVNPAMARLFDKPAAEFRGLDECALFPPEVAREIAEVDRRVLAGETVEELNQRTIGAQARHLHTIKVPLRSPEGATIGLCGVARDVTEREKAQQELAKTQRRLVEVSRRAGMAEVATSVLHNVGNVLNSVNVSAHVVAQTARDVGGVRLATVAEMLQAHAADLAGFLTTDLKGRMIPDYLRQVAAHQENQRQEMQAELQRLTRNVDHIKEIVAMQQSYAQVGGVLEPIEPSQLLADVLQLCRDDLQQAAIEVVQDYQPVPRGLLDRHRLLQILVNVIRNALDAMAVGEGERRHRLTLSLRLHGAGRFQVRIQDTGVGIAPENLTRIFQHGFTTKPHGHGFGLHAAALSAREMGGSLEAESPGVMKGATFTLELPLSAAQTTAPSSPMVV